MFVCPFCKFEKSMDRASKRMREGLRSVDRCLDCEAHAQKKARETRGDEINSKRRANWHRHKDKQKDTALKSKYGIGVQEWNALFEHQDKKCAICFSASTNGRGWQTDHDHTTGVVRNILCHNCNSLLGHARESPQILLNAFRYLYIHGGGPETFFKREFGKELHEGNTI